MKKFALGVSALGVTAALAFAPVAAHAATASPASPRLTISSPATYTPGQSLTITGTGVPSATITAKAPGSTLAPVSSTVSGKGTWSITFAQGLRGPGQYALLVDEKSGTKTASTEQWLVESTSGSGAGPVVDPVVDPVVEPVVDPGSGAGPVDPGTGHALAFTSRATYVAGQSLTVSGRGTPGASITAEARGGLLYGSTKVAADGTWSVVFPTGLRGPGQYLMQITQKTTAGSSTVIEAWYTAAK